MLNAFALCKFSCISVRCQNSITWKCLCLLVYLMTAINIITMRWKTKIPHCRNNSKNTTLSKQFQNPIEKSKRKIKTSNIHMHNDSLSWLSTSTSIKSDRAKLVVWSQTSPLMEMMGSYKCFAHVSKMSSITYNQENSVIIKNAIILNIMHNIFNLRDTEVVIG